MAPLPVDQSMLATSCQLSQAKEQLRAQTTASQYRFGSVWVSLQFLVFATRPVRFSDGFGFGWFRFLAVRPVFRSVGSVHRFPPVHPLDPAKLCVFLLTFSDACQKQVQINTMYSCLTLAFAEVFK